MRVAVLRRASTADSLCLPQTARIFQSSSYFQFISFVVAPCSIRLSAVFSLQGRLSHHPNRSIQYQYADARHHRLRYIRVACTANPPPAVKGFSVVLIGAVRVGMGESVQRMAAVNSMRRTSATSGFAWARAGRHKWRGSASRRMAGRPCAFACSFNRLQCAERTFYSHTYALRRDPEPYVRRHACRLV